MSLPDVYDDVPEAQLRALEGSKIPPITLRKILDDLVPLFAVQWRTRSQLDRLTRLREVHRAVRRDRDALSIRYRDRSDAAITALAEGVAIISLRTPLPMYGRIYDHRHLRGGLS